MKYRSNNNILRNPISIFITWWVGFILTSKITVSSLGNIAFIIDDLFVAFCCFFFIKELCDLNSKRILLLNMLIIWLYSTFFISFFQNAPGYYLTLIIYLKPIILIAGVLILIRREYLNLRVIERIIFLSACYGIIQFFVYFFTQIVLPGGGDKLLRIFGWWFLRSGGFCGHPNIFGMTLIPFVLVYLLEKKYVKFFIITVALFLAMSRWPIFLAVILVLLNCPIKKKIAVTLFILLFGLFIGQPVYQEYSRVYRGYNQRNTIKLYGMKVAKEIFLDFPILGAGIGNFGSKYSTGSDIYKRYSFNNKMYSNLKYATSGIESGLAIIMAECGLFLGILYLAIIFQCFNIALEFFHVRTVRIFSLFFLSTFIFYNQYLPEFIITLLSAMYIVSKLKENRYQEKDSQLYFK